MKLKKKRIHKPKARMSHSTFMFASKSALSTGGIFFFWFCFVDSAVSSNTLTGSTAGMGNQIRAGFLKKMWLFFTRWVKQLSGCYLWPTALHTRHTDRAAWRHFFFYFLNLPTWPQRRKHISKCWVQKTHRQQR